MKKLFVMTEMLMILTVVMVSGGYFDVKIYKAENFKGVLFIM